MSSIPDDKLVPLEQEFGQERTDRTDLSDRFMDGDVPWSDDMLDKGVHYLRISRELLGIVDD